MAVVKSKTKKAETKEKTVKKEPAGLGFEKNTTLPHSSFSKGEGKSSPTLPRIKYGASSKWRETDLNIPVYNQEGKETGNIDLPQEIFGLKVNQNLVVQAVNAQMANSRQHLAHAKDRSEVRGGGKKPWRQKGTGRARHSSIRSPLWRGGGVTFGPRKEKNFAKKINKKMKRQALLMVLSGKVKDNELVVLDNLALSEPKTKLMVRVLKNIFGALALAREKSPTKTKTPVKAPVRTPSAMIVLAKNDENVVRAARNLPKISTIGVASLNVKDLLSVKYLLMPKEAIEKIKQTFSKSF